MATAIYDVSIAWDAITRRGIPGQVARVVDATTDLPIESVQDLDGTPIAALVSNSQGYVPPFQVVDGPALVKLQVGPVTYTLLDQTRIGAATAAAETAARAAQDAAALVEAPADEVVAMLVEGDSLTQGAGDTRWVTNDSADTKVGGLLSNSASEARAAANSVIDQRTSIITIRNFGAVGDESTDDTSSIRNAIAAAVNSDVVYPSGKYRVTGPLPGFWAAGRSGDGILTDGTNNYRVTPRHFGDINTIWVNGDTGSDDNDGLFPATAVKTLSAVNSILAGFRGEAERGTWKIRLSGNIQGGFTFTALPLFRNYLTFEGDPLVGGKPATSISFVSGGSAFGLRFEPSEYLKIRVLNLRFNNFSVGSNGYGLLMKGGGTLQATDCVADGCDIGFAAVNNVSYTFTRCVSRNNTADGFRSQYSSSGGWAGCHSHNNAGNGFFISRNSVGHLDDSIAESNGQNGLLADMSTRIATIGTSFKKNQRGVRLEGGSEWNRDETRPNLFHIGTADANTVAPFSFFGNSRLTTLHSIKATNEFRLFGATFNASGSTWHTGTTTDTLLINPPSDQIIPPEMFLDGGKKLRVRFWGRHQGTGAKTVTLKVGDTNYVVSATAHQFPLTAGGLKTFRAEVELSARPTVYGSMDGFATTQESGAMSSLTVLNFGFNPANGIRPRVYASLSDVGGQIRIDGFEIYVMG